MYRRLFVTAVLCVGLMAMMGVNDAKAWPRIAGWGGNLGSFNCFTDVRGLGNPDINDYQVTCELSQIQLLVPCMNGGGGTGGLGTPFNPDSTLSSDYQLTFVDFTSRGKATSNNYFSDCMFYDFALAYEEDNGPICQNSNWSLVVPEEYPSCSIPDPAEPDVVTSPEYLLTHAYVCIEVEDYLAEDDILDLYHAEGTCDLITENSNGDLLPIDEWYYNCIELDSGRGACTYPPPAE